MTRNEQILLTEAFVKERIAGYDSGHDWTHIERVRKLALYINEVEFFTDPFLIEITALLHDTADSKFAGEKTDHIYRQISDFMDKNQMSEIKDQVMNVIKNISFSSKNEPGNINDPLFWVVQDADRLDAIGAIGIARAFNYGGFRNNPIYIPDENSGTQSRSTVSHFYCKLLKLNDMMNTRTGRKIAEKRHEFLEKFLEQFYIEWYFNEKQLY